MSICISINDFPTEIIEKFAPDDSTSTLKILRSVNKRFYDVFSQDKFWKRHLKYSHEHYLCDMLCKLNIPRVKDVVNDFAEDKVSKIHGFYRLQIAHFENWLSGPTQIINTIDVLPSTVLFMEDIIDDENELWLFLSVGENIHIWNITARPFPLNPVKVGPHTKLKVIPGFKVVLFNKNNGLVTVYTFNKAKMSLLKKFLYYLESSTDPPRMPTAKCRFSFITVGSHGIGYNRNITSYQNNLLHIWNLNNCIKKGSISLSELDFDNEFQRFVLACSTAFRKDISVNSKGCKIDLYPSVYPNVAVGLRYLYDRLSAASILNVELMRVTHFIDTLNSDIIYCSINCNIVSVVAHSHVINYSTDVSTIPESDRVLYCEQLTFIECENMNKNNILFKNTNMVIKIDNRVDIMSLVSEALSTTTVNVEQSFTILAFLEPNILLMYDFKNPSRSDIKVYFIPSGREIFTLRNVDIGLKKFQEYYWKLSYPSKLVLDFNTGNFKLLYF